ncbi:hypothetical protein HMPREF9466_01620 [Fusobacterium necrophorum subsp. funduliforme 1_1_36S]|nr:hypothetical protein HMPREF9466_01620 [Fusobacterium necrophorum subsp. funduliforme 1_1_36S]
MSNNVYKQLMFQTLRAGKQGNGTLLQVSLTRNGSLMFHMAQQNGINQNGLPTFDHQNASKFSFSNIESASIVNFIENAMQGELKKYLLCTETQERQKILFLNRQYTTI